MIVGMGMNDAGEVIGAFQVKLDLNAWDVADIIARQIAGETFADDDGAAYLAGVDREAAIALVVAGLEFGGREEGGMVGNEPDDWYGAYGVEPSLRAVELVRRVLPEFDDIGLENYENHIRQADEYAA